MAIDLLGHYLATAPDDGRAWLQLGRFYLFDARDWHLHGHRGDPDGLLYLDFAATALDQAVRLSVDSGLVFRGVAEVDRALVMVEDSGWDAAPLRPTASPTPRRCPPSSSSSAPTCSPRVPSGGVLLTGSDLEAVSVWYGSLQRAPLDILPIRPDLYATDSVYRLRMAAAMGVDPALPVQRALAAVVDQPDALPQPDDRSRRRARARVGAVPPGAGQPAGRARAGRAQRRRAAQGLRARTDRPGCRTSAASTRPPPATTSCSAAACSSSSGTAAAGMPARGDGVRRGRKGDRGAAFLSVSRPLV